MAKIPADDGGGGGSFGEELWGGGIAVMRRGRWTMESSELLFDQFEF